MDKLEKLFIDLIAEKRSVIGKYLRDCIIEDTVVTCIDIFYGAKAKGENLSSGQLYKKMIEKLDEIDGLEEDGD